MIPISESPEIKRKDLAAMRKYSRQREAIKDYLMSREDHPTAEMVYMNVRLTNPKISLGTVYRNLSLLEEDGEITKVSCGDGVERYDARVEPHFHYHCKSCGCVKDLPLEFIRTPEEMLPASCDDGIEGYSILFYGTCKNCRKDS